MTDIYWPLKLPQVLMTDGLSAKKKSCVIRTEMDAGPAKQRRRYTVSTKEVTGTILLTTQQLLRFESFYDNEIGCGALRFQMKDPQTLEWAQFRFTDNYSIDSADGLWRVNLPLEKMNA